jgi:type II secretory pathway pseudopilin PulG
MTLNKKPDHNMFGMPQATRTSLSSHRRPEFRMSQAGYTLVALLALMTLLAMFAAAAAPSIVQQAKREREKEAIFRGEQVADAIRVYYRAKSLQNLRGDTGLPTSIDQLLEGVQIPGRTKKLQILRPSAARDSLSSSGEWRLIKPRSPEITDFVRQLMIYTANVLPPTRDPQLQQAQPNMVPIVVSVLGLDPSNTSSQSGLSEDSTGPFIGVSSRSKSNSVITYYGIDRHDQWIFTPFFR